MYRFLLSIVLLLFALPLAAQVKVAGKVTDETNLPLPGANILVHGSSKGVTTDLDGNYFIEVKKGDVLDFSYVGYKLQSRKVTGGGKNVTLNVILKEDAQQLSDVVVVGYGTQKKESIVSSVSTVKGADLKIPSRSIINGLAGQVAGLIYVQRSGEPGYDTSEFFIRGISSFAGGTNPLVLVDGVPRSMSDIEPDEIESFTLLKDAAATAVYGAQGANGVVLITSKQGALREKTKISFRAETTVSAPTRLPKFLGSVDFMNLYNEALENEGKAHIYPQSLIDKYAAHTDNDLYPDVNWLDLLKKSTVNSRYTLSFRGGGQRSRFFISGAYYDESGLFKSNPKKEYENNIGVKRYNLRSNVDLEVSNSTTLGVNLSGQYLQNVYPGVGTDALFHIITLTPPNLFPMQFSNGMHAGHPRGIGSDTRKNPYNLLMESGYAKEWRSNIQSAVTLKQDLDVLTKGLKFRAMVSYDASSTMVGRRSKTPAQYIVDYSKNGGRDINGNLNLKQMITEVPLTSLNASTSSSKRIYIESALEYKRIFNTKHNLTGLLLYNHSDSQTNDNLLAYRKQGYVGRAVYIYDKRYSVEANFGFTGSENFAEGHRFGFFPAIGLAWIVDNEPYYGEKLRKVMNGLKVRVSYGRTGNDNTGGERFLYRPSYEQGAYGYGYGINNNGGINYLGGITEGRFASPNLGWEIEDKQNYGVDLAFFNNRITLQADYFNNRRHDILLQRQMVPSQNGFIKNPWQNFGIVTNEGVDASFSAKTLIKDFSVGMRGNFTYARNKIVERDETPNRYEWMNSTGQPLRKDRLYVAERLLTDDDFNITTDGSGKKTYTPKAHIPRSSMQPELRPGDIKYADLNNDGEIDQYDQKYGDWHPNTPEISYGVGFNFGYKNLYLNVFFQGVGNVSTVLGGNNPEGFFPFTWGVEASSLRAEALNRWTAANPSQDVLYPRLRTANNGHNQVASTWWLRDASFIRFKNLEIGYNLPKDLLKKLRLTSGRMYLMGNNLYVWDTIKMWDPEMGNANAGMKYPLQRTFTFGLDFSL